VLPFSFLKSRKVEKLFLGTDDQIMLMNNRR